MLFLSASQNCGSRASRSYCWNPVTRHRSPPNSCPPFQSLSDSTMESTMGNAITSR